MAPRRRRRKLSEYRAGLYSAETRKSIDARLKKGAKVLASGDCREARALLFSIPDMGLAASDNPDEKRLSKRYAALDRKYWARCS